MLEVQAKHVEPGCRRHPVSMADLAVFVEHGNLEPRVRAAETGRPDHRLDASGPQVELGRWAAGVDPFGALQSVEAFAGSRAGDEAIDPVERPVHTPVAVGDRLPRGRLGSRHGGRRPSLSDRREGRHALARRPGRCARATVARRVAATASAAPRRRRASRRSSYRTGRCDQATRRCPARHTYAASAWGAD